VRDGRLSAPVWVPGLEPELDEKAALFGAVWTSDLRPVYARAAIQGAMKKTMRAFLADETAATAIEYGLIAAGIALAIIAIVNNLGTTRKPNSPRSTPR
jgi:pilus assembly protein Flp/PilA